MQTLGVCVCYRKAKHSLTIEMAFTIQPLQRSIDIANFGHHSVDDNEGDDDAAQDETQYENGNAIQKLRKLNLGRTLRRDGDAMV